MMVQLGLFAFNGRSYQITVPETVTLESVQQAALDLPATARDVGDGVEAVQPERLLHTLPETVAEAWRSLLIQKRRFDAGNLGEMRSIGGARLSLSRAGFRILERPLFVIG
jgi:hypothetical protein